MEQTAMSFCGWSLLGGDVCAQGKNTAKILHRFPFSSALKRMSCAVQYIDSASGKKRLLVTSKGAPETIAAHLSVVPNEYEKTYRQLATSGARVIALAYKEMDSALLKAISATTFPVTREEAECDLIFAGFLVFHCPLKPDTAAAITALRESLHRVVMITGDAALTAIHTAKQLNMTRGKPVLLIDLKDSEIAFVDPVTDILQKFPFDMDLFDYCIVGSALEELQKLNSFNFIEKHENISKFILIL
jgi:cation-transporting ATPase 13A1